MKEKAAAMERQGKITQLRPRTKCPECGEKSSQDSFPFCSPRCKALDLNRWLRGAYVIPATDEEDEKPES